MLEYEVELLLYHYPEAKGRVIGINDMLSKFNFPNENNLMVKSMGNIILIRSIMI